MAYNIDSSIEMTDWLRATTWDLPTDPEAFIRMIGGVDKLDHFMTMPSAKAMPDDLKVALSGLNLTKHLAGKHDQSSHAGGREDSSEGLSELAKTSIKDWSEASYLDVAQYLRGTSSSLSNPIKGKQVADGLDEAFASTSPLTQSTSSQRRVVGEFADKIKSMEVGEGWQDKGFVATSQSKKYITDTIAGDKRYGTNSIMLNVKIPAGVKAIDVNSVLGEHGRSKEQELLLNRNLIYTITNKTDDVIDVEVSNG